MSVKYFSIIYIQWIKFDNWNKVYFQIRPVNTTDVTSNISLNNDFFTKCYAIKKISACKIVFMIACADSIN